MNTTENQASVRTRIAPSPTGYPHIGTVYQGLFDYIFARKHQGTFVIRIEDTDVKRRVEGAEAVIYEALEYYGLTPDEGPKYGGDYGPYRQSERLASYQQHARQLVEGQHAYYCFCSPDELAEHRQKQQKAGHIPMYSKKCRQLDPSDAAKRAGKEPHVIRMKIPPDETIVVYDQIRGDISFDSSVIDDQVILKSDGYPTYHLAVVVDDYLMKITHVIRGEEWISSAPKHVLLYRYFGWDLPQFIHLPLLRNPDRSKISKRHGHTSAFWYRDQGYLVEAVLNFLATRVWNHPEGKEVFDIKELTKHFRFEDMHIQGPIVDLDKLNWLNGQWIRRLSDREIRTRLKDYTPEKVSDDLLKKLLPHIKERLVTLSEITALTDYFVKAPNLDHKSLIKQSKMTAAETLAYLEKVRQIIASAQPWQAQELETRLRELQALENLKPRAAFMTIRIALTGREATPPLFDVMEMLGKEEVLSRLNQALIRLKTG